jgi:AbiU2
MYLERITKLKAYVENLLDLFLKVKEINAFLAPMLFEQWVVDKYGHGEKARGFNAIKFSLYYTCIQQLAKLESDTDPKTPTIKYVLEVLADERLRNILRTDFVNSFVSFVSDLDPVSARKRKDTEKQIEVQHGREFDELYTATLGLVDEKYFSEEIKKFRTIRDKLTAHSELKKDGLDYKLLDVTTLGLTYGSVEKVIDRVQQIIANLNRLVRSASFDFDGVQANLEKARAAYWEV